VTTGGACLAQQAEHLEYSHAHRPCS
jgi:hypothetical protein